VLGSSVPNAQGQFLARLPWGNLTSWAKWRAILGKVFVWKL